MHYAYQVVMNYTAFHMRNACSSGVKVTFGEAPAASVMRLNARKSFTGRVTELALSRT